MLFNLFGKKAAGDTDKLFKDKVYITSIAKMNACVQLAQQHPEAIFIGWFKETVIIYKALFKQNNINENRVVPAEAVTEKMLQNNTPVFVEHHPLLAKEETLTANWQHRNIWVFSAMDEPLFKHFGSDKMIPLIKLFGMKDSEAIEHSYVTESILKGQNKIAAKVLIEHPSQSQAEWMDKHMQP